MCNLPGTSWSEAQILRETRQKERGFVRNSGF